MTEFNKIQYYDLRLEALKKRLPTVIGRGEESYRLARTVKRSLFNNALIVGPSGIGKTTFVRGWAKQALLPEQQQSAFIEVDINSLYALQLPNAPLSRYQEALATLPAGILYIDDFGQLIHHRTPLLQSMFQLLKPCLDNPKIAVVLTLEPLPYAWMMEQEPSLRKYFEPIDLKDQPEDEQMDILRLALARLRPEGEPKVSDETLQRLLEYVKKFPSLGQAPKAAISLLDEALAAARVTKQPEVNESLLRTIIADKTNIPLQQLQGNDIARLKTLEADLNKIIVGQKEPLRTISRSIQRAKLGLKNPHRPLASFLVLGPSGVGKTETAKLVAEKVFGRKENFLRLDMSEFGEAHMAQRLTGAPPGYVGYDAGGGLTDPVAREPHSLVLLDEIEKAHGKVFDVFLQILDDGRLTSGQGRTVDFTNTIIMATSNLAVDAIIDRHRRAESIQDAAFLQEEVLPLLAKHFRMEFLNRFDAIVIYNPLGEAELLEIALLEIKKIEQRTVQHRINFTIDPAVLQERIKQFADPRLGARPVKRFIEETCETLIAEALLQ